MSESCWSPGIGWSTAPLCRFEGCDFYVAVLGLSAATSWACRCQATNLTNTSRPCLLDLARDGGVEAGSGGDARTPLGVAAGRVGRYRRVPPRSRLARVRHRKHVLERTDRSHTIPMCGRTSGTRP